MLLVALPTRSKPPRQPRPPTPPSHSTSVLGAATTRALREGSALTRLTGAVQSGLGEAAAARVRFALPTRHVYMAGVGSSAATQQACEMETSPAVRLLMELGKPGEPEEARSCQAGGAFTLEEGTQW